MTQNETEEESPRCQVCGKPKNDHNFRHAFIMLGHPSILVEVTPPEGIPAIETEEGPRPAVRVAPPGDPVLRLALIRKGVITLEDLETVEAELRGAGVAFHDPKALG